MGNSQEVTDNGCAPKHHSKVVPPNPTHPKEYIHLYMCQ